MVLLTTTPQILDILTSLPPSTLESIPRGNTTALPNDVSQPISHESIVGIHRLTLKDGTKTPLNTLLRGIKPYVPPPPARPEPSLEYVALMNRLRQEQEQKEYAALVSKQRNELNPNDEEQEDNISPSLVLNILLSVILCAVAVFQLTKWWNDDGVRVLFSLGSALVVGVAEVGIYSIYLRKVKSAKEKERSKKEKKTLIGEYRDDSIEDEVSLRSIETQEKIWGKGINGGMRRRIRDNWEKDQNAQLS